MKTTAARLIGVVVAAVLATAGTALAQEAAPTAAQKDRNSYVVFKGGGWSMKDDDVKDPDTGTYWEIAFGGKFNPYVGGEFSFGYMSTEGKFLFIPTKVRSIPLDLSLRLGLPITVVEPYVMLGGGLYVNTLEVGPASATTVNLGYHGGLGIDVNLGALVVGLEGRYFVMKGEILGQSVDLDGSTVAMKVGIRY